MPDQEDRRSSSRNPMSSGTDDVFDQNLKEKVGAECVEDVTGGERGGYISPIEIQARFASLRDLSSGDMDRLNARVRKIIDWRMMPCVSIMFLMK